MDFRVELSFTAERELNEIIEFFISEYDNHQLAERFYTTVRQKISNIEFNPFGYPRCLNEALFKKGYRYIIVGKYLILYVIDEKNFLVTVRHIIYGGCNLNTID